MADTQRGSRDGKGRTKMAQPKVLKGNGNNVDPPRTLENKKIKPFFHNCREVFSAEKLKCKDCGRCQKILVTFDQHNDADVSQQQRAAQKKSHCKLADPLLESGQRVTFGRCVGDFFSKESPVCLECNLLCQSIKRVYRRPGFAHLENLNLEKGAKNVCSCPNPDLCVTCGICDMLQSREISSFIQASQVCS